MNIKDFGIGIIIFLVLLSFSSLFAYFDSPELQCDKFEGKEKDICILKFAKEKDNTKSCEGIKDFVLSHLCFDNIWARENCDYEQIINEGHPECITDYNQKYFDLAITENNPEYCKKIRTYGLREECSCNILFNMSCEEKEFQDEIQGQAKTFHDALPFIQEYLESTPFCQNQEVNEKLIDFCYLYSLDNLSTESSLGNFDTFLWYLIQISKNNRFDCDIFKLKNQPYLVTTKIDISNDFYMACSAIINKKERDCKKINVKTNIKLHRLNNICESWSNHNKTNCSSISCLFYFYTD